MVKRIITGIIGIPVLLFFILTDYFNNLPFLIFILILNFVAQLELHQMFCLKKVNINKLFFLLSGFVLLLSFYFSVYSFSKVIVIPDDTRCSFIINHYFGMTYLFLVLIYAVAQIFKENYDNVITKAAYFTFGLFYLPLLIGHFLLLKVISSAYLFMIVLLIWFNDSFAYFFGMALGKKKLPVKASPNKSYAGLIAGLVFSIIAVFISEALFKEKIGFTLYHKIFIGLFFGMIVVLSDLLESIIKRSVKIKDSNAVLPGHGGILDTFDGWFLTIPAFYYYLVFIG